MPIKLIRLLSLTFCISHYSSAQSIIPRFESLGVNDGLPHSSVYSIYQDKKGFMWFGTADGLCSYDGNKLKSFKYSAAREGDVVNNTVKKLLEDKQGNLWYSNETGIYKWNMMTEKVSREMMFDRKEFNNSRFTCISIDDKSVLWMVNPFKGVFEYNTRSKKLKNYPLPLKINYTDILNAYQPVSDATGNFWFRINNGNDPYLCFEKASHKYFTWFADDPPQAIFFNKNNKVLSYSDRLVLYNADSQKTYVVPKILNGKQVSFISDEGLPDSYDRLWLTLRGDGLCYYDRKQDRFYSYHHDNLKLKTLPFNLATCLFIDRDDNLWIGSDGGGVARLDLKQPRFNLFPLSEGDYPILSDYFSKCFYEDERQRIWFGTHSNGLNIYNPVTAELINFKHDVNKPGSIPGNIVGSIIRDREGNMWIGTSGGICLFNEKTVSFKKIAIKDLLHLSPQAENFIFKMIQLHNGDLLAATSIGLIRITKKEGQYSGEYFKKITYLASACTDIAEMPGGTIYLTTPGFGLYELSPGKSMYDIVQVFFKDNDLRSVRIDEKNTDYLWIGSSIGLIHFNTITHEYKLWNEKNGIANSYVYGSLEDAKGNLWISTNKGLSFFDQGANKFENYSFLDGLQSNEFNTQAFYKSGTGIFYFGGIKGFNWFTPDYTGKKQAKPIAAITGFEINDSIFQKDSAYTLNRSVTVSHDQNDFNFHFAALNYTRPAANRIEYMLQGWDKAWTVAENNSARYANLLPAKYILRVKVANAEGTWSEEERITVIIKAPFWKQGWFIALVGLFFLLCVIFITWRISLLRAKRKLQLLEKQIAVEAERNRISADMHDEIGSGITHIALLSELMLTQHKGVTELKKDVQIISTSARRLVQTISEIIWALNPQNDTLENLLAYTRERSHQYFESFDMQLFICFPEKIPFIQLTNEKRRNLYLVTKEILHNAMKHSGATRVDLKVEISSKECCFIVTDNGIGMNEENIRPDSNGIRNLKKRMQNIGGVIEWLSDGKGTAVKYSLPV